MKVYRRVVSSGGWVRTAAIVIAMAVAGGAWADPALHGEVGEVYRGAYAAITQGEAREGVAACRKVREA